MQLRDTQAMSGVTLAVLAGGEGRRLGHAKGLLEIAGLPILRRLLERLAWPGPTLLVTAPGRERPPGWQLFDREAVDPVAGEGPLRGILTALEHASTEFMVVTVVDMPAVLRPQLEWLAGQLAADPAALGVMTRRAQVLEPFPSAFRRTAAGELVCPLLSTGERAPSH